MLAPWATKRPMVTMGGVAKMPAAGLCWLLLLVGVVLAIGVAADSPAAASPAGYDFVIKETTVTRLCHDKTILAVNGQFPGPTIYAHKGDVIVVNVYNQGSKNITIHWHGVDQPRNPWSDGPEYITQCPIQPGASFTYTVIFTEEEGTLFWHAHSDYDRATVHGAIVIQPKDGSAYPYPAPDGEVPIILGEWWNADVEQVLLEAQQTGAAFNVSDANTINGQPGDYAPCSMNDTFKVPVEHGKTYLLRIINAGLTNDMFFAVAGHRLTVVGTDGHYLKPFTVDYIRIASGQTMNVLLEANRAINGSGDNSRYYMAASPFFTLAGVAPYDDKNATAILEYTAAAPSTGPPDSPCLPRANDVAAATAFTAQLRSLATTEHPVDVPMVVDEHMLVAISQSTLPCGANKTRTGPLGGRIAESLNSVSFVAPLAIDILDAYHDNITGVYDADFPDRPPPPLLNFTNKATKVKVVEYGTVVEVVLQDDLTGESHPIHLHGFSFYVVGRGFGTFDKFKDPASYNLVDPPYQNTVSTPPGGWAALRFRATNPGVWFMHCHFDPHQVWGMDTVFIVRNGETSETQMMPRSPNMPKC